jgi:hypothetical protein
MNKLMIFKRFLQIILGLILVFVIIEGVLSRMQII